MDSIWSNQTWEFEDLPPGTTPLSCKWVFKLKLGIDGAPHKKKARLVSYGFKQTAHIHFQETFALVIKWATIRLAIALGAAN